MSLCQHYMCLKYLYLSAEFHQVWKWLSWLWLIKGQVALLKLTKCYTESSYSRSKATIKNIFGSCRHNKTTPKATQKNILALYSRTIAMPWTFIINPIEWDCIDSMSVQCFLNDYVMIYYPNMVSFITLMSYIMCLCHWTSYTVQYI